MCSSMHLKGRLFISWQDIFSPRITWIDYHGGAMSSWQSTVGSVSLCTVVSCAPVKQLNQQKLEWICELRLCTNFRHIFLLPYYLFTSYINIGTSTVIEIWWFRRERSYGEEHASCRTFERTENHEHRKWEHTGDKLHRALRTYLQRVNGWHGNSKTCAAPYRFLCFQVNRSTTFELIQIKNYSSHGC